MSLLSSSASATASTSPLLVAAASATHDITNRKWILKRHPIGLFDPALDVELVPDNNDNDEEKDADELQDTEIVVQPQLLSVDAFLRTMCDEHAYHGSIELGQTFPALGYGKVLRVGAKSTHKVGACVVGMLAAADTITLDGTQAMPSMKFPFLSRSSSLGLMGLTAGLTAYCGVFYVPSRIPRKGETVVVTGAAGSVGSIAVQLCQSTGARVIGVAGGTRKTQYLINDLHCEGAIDYKNTSTQGMTLEEQITKACPTGIDFIYDNVGGRILDALMYHINPKGRIVICGAISQYSGQLNKEGTEGKSHSMVMGPSNYLKLAERGAEMKGFNVMQYMSKLPFMVIGMYYLYLRGYVKVEEHIEDGLDKFPLALQKLFTGETIGKTLVRINPE
mmetsp:Transcript_28672/g.30816  ORF Transcript_28672/g.30816 Transcript_28672/m.30816 type:complete len:391 (+) Transcript_28672:66-1238(+)